MPSPDPISADEVEASYIDNRAPDSTCGLCAGLDALKAKVESL